jgi:parallel beta-helix repeat protein
MNYKAVVAAFFIFVSAFSVARAQSFVHPGIDQSKVDLDHMKSLVLKGEEPWKSAYDRMKAAADTPFKTQPFTHVLRGGYGRPNIGGNELSRSANMAYNYTLVWYIGGEKKYAEKAIDILNAWSPVLWDFDLNDAKLLAAWTGHMLCNAAEILRHTNAGWKTEDQEQFSRMLMTVYYPLLRYYYPQANGNWDGAIIHTLLAIAIFTDNRGIFNNAVDHFLHSPVNGSLFKYIYPHGQCQESLRDQGHVQLGLGEFAGCAQVAFTQGTDLFAAGNNRLALGYEFTAGFLLGQKPDCYGPISERAKELRDDYEAVYRHYAAQGINLPFTKRAADSVRTKASRSILTAVRAPRAQSKAATTLTAGKIKYGGALHAKPVQIPADAIIVSPGASVQDALNNAAGKNKWVIIKAGIHTLPKPLEIPSGVTICGEGISSVLFLDPNGGRDAMMNAVNDLKDVTIRNLVVECSNKTEIPSDPNSARSYRAGYNRGGIVFRALEEGQMKNINLVNITVRNATCHGVFMSGAENVTIDGCDFDENGATVVPGPRLQHNLLLSHCRKVNIREGRFTTSPNGAGIAMDHCSDIDISNCEIARNGYYGAVVMECKNVAISKSQIEANDRSGVMVEFLRDGSDKVIISGNLIQYNAGYGVEMYSAKNSKSANNRYYGNGKIAAQEKVSNEKYIVME